MKEFRFRIFLIVALVALSVYLLYPTYQDSVNTSDIKKSVQTVKDSILKVTPQISSTELNDKLQYVEDSIRVSDPDIAKTREKRVKLGLDLQGGMYLVMEVNTTKLLEQLAKDPDDNFKALLTEAGTESATSDESTVQILARKLNEKGIRLSRYFGTIREEDAEILDKLNTQEADAVTRAIEIISNRVNQYGVSEPSIQKQGSRRIVVELPGIAKEEEAKRLLQGTALLEFRMVKDAEFAFPIMNKIDEILAAQIPQDSTEVKDTLLNQESQSQSEEEFAKKHPFFAIARLLDPQGRIADAFVSEEDKAKIQNILERPDVKKVIPDNVEFLFDAKAETGDDGVSFYRMYMVNKTAELTGGVITDAMANIDPQTSQPVVSMQMDSEGALEWARITGANINKRCAIVLDGGVYSAPNIINKIPNGSSQITGIPDLDEAKLLEIVLKAGALPAPVDLIEERIVGPSLGEDSINQGLNSAVIGFLVVAIFMIFYYKISGSIADFALFFTILLIMGILAGFNATLTLPGIAGIVLTIGMAVDANVIIFERIREELSTGKTIKASIEGGFANSYSAIFDGNLTTFFTALILYQFGSGPIQGFALTLMIGLGASMFSALVITRVILDIMASKGMKINVG